MGNEVYLPILSGPRCVGTNWIHVREDNVGTCGVFFIVVVFAIQAKRDRMVRVQRFDLIICSLGSVQSIHMSI